MSFIIAVSNLKGGVAKTTSSMLLAAQINKSLPGQVVVLDSDKQGSASLWANKGNFAVKVVPADTADLPGQIAQLYKEYKAVIIDCPPSADALVTAMAIAHANLVVMPCPPSFMDYEATTMMLAVVEASDARPPVLVVPTVVPTTMTSVAKAALDSMRATLPVSSSALYLRTAYREAAALGTGLDAVQSRGAHQAQRELSELTQEILLKLSGA